MNEILFLLNYRRTNAGRRCHCDLVPTVLFTERSETSKEIELDLELFLHGPRRLSLALLGLSAIRNWDFL